MAHRQPFHQNVLHAAIAAFLNRSLRELENKSVILYHAQQAPIHLVAGERFVNMAMVFLEDSCTQYKECRWWISILDKYAYLLKQYDTQKANRYGGYVMAFHEAMDRALTQMEIFRALSKMVRPFQCGPNGRSFWRWFIRVDYYREIAPGYRRLALEWDIATRERQQSEEAACAAAPPFCSEPKQNFVKKQWLRLKDKVSLFVGKMKKT